MHHIIQYSLCSLTYEHVPRVGLREGRGLQAGVDAGQEDAGRARARVHLPQPRHHRGLGRFLMGFSEISSY